MWTWLIGAGTKGIARWVWILMIAGVLAAIILSARFFITTAFDRTEELGREAGESGAVIKGQNQTLDQLGDANDAENDLRSGGERSAARYEQCLLDNTRPGACERYNPDPGE